MKYIHIEIVEAEPEIANHSTEKIKEGEEGMLVTCKSGYKHFVPKKVFDRRYLPIIPNPKLTKSDVSVSQDMVDRFISDVDPVSYTHLDVYKRQVINCPYSESVNGD